ncbi:hypothetical protein HDU89_008744 [Geranomyces variabilis]|nr:hypothetical protein HDU89_008744 [Geranomyces variabilis]
MLGAYESHSRFLPPTPITPGCADCAGTNQSSSSSDSSSSRFQQGYFCAAASMPPPMHHPYRQLSWAAQAQGSAAREQSSVLFLSGAPQLPSHPLPPPHVFGADYLYYHPLGYNVQPISTMWTPPAALPAPFVGKQSNPAPLLTSALPASVLALHLDSHNRRAPPVMTSAIVSGVDPPTTTASPPRKKQRHSKDSQGLVSAARDDSDDNDDDDHDLAAHVKREHSASPCPVIASSSSARQASLLTSTEPAELSSSSSSSMEAETGMHKRHVQRRKTDEGTRRKNTEAARRSREKKAHHLQELESHVAHLESALRSLSCCHAERVRELQEAGRREQVLRLRVAELEDMLAEAHECIRECIKEGPCSLWVGTPMSLAR